MTRLFLTAALLAPLALAGCKSGDKTDPGKKDPARTDTAKKDPPPAGKPDAGTEPAAAGDAGATATDAKDDAGAATGAATDAEPAADQDYIRVLASHQPAKEGDPVKVYFQKFAVTKAAFDPAKVEGGTAEIEIDLTSLSSGIERRDADLKSKGFLEVEKYPKAVVKISDVKKGGAENQFTAKAEVDIHGEKVSWPVKFEVLEKTADGIRVQGSHEFKRTEVKIGAPPSDQAGVADGLKFELRLLVKKTG